MIEQGHFKWGKDDAVCLNNINLRVKKGSLTAIVGSIGSGKSSLLSALLGEMEKSSGRVKLAGSKAYVPQQPWMQNATIQQNILFGKRYQSAAYEKTINACALSSDIDILPGKSHLQVYNAKL